MSENRETVSLTEDSSTGASEHDPAAQRVARGVRDVELAEYQRIVCSLLKDPFVRPSEAARLTAVRRFESPLRDDIETLLRYRLEVGSECARLVKRPVRLDASRPAVAGSGRRVFDHRRYTYLCLLSAVLLRTGSQVLLSDLADRLRSDAAEIVGLGFDPDQHQQRLAFVDAVRWLEEHEALRLRAGATEADVGAEALYDVADDVVHLLVPSLGLRDLTSVAQRFAETHGDSRDERRARVRQRVLRSVIEDPSVLYSDLLPDEQAWLRRVGGRLVDDLERLCGLPVERRAEGVALIDPNGDASDRAFPSGGSGSQLALLLADRLTNEPASLRVVQPRRDETHLHLTALLDAALRAARFDGAGPPGSLERDQPDPAEVHSRFDDPTDTDGSTEMDDSTDSAAPKPVEPVALVPAWSMDELSDIVSDLVATTPGVRRDLRDDPAEALRVALAELESFDLGRLVWTTRIPFDPSDPSRSGGNLGGEPLLVLVAPVWRYRAGPPPESPRGRADSDDDQLGLFGTDAP